MQTFEGRVAVITGASLGIGRSLAWKCAREGMKVVIVSSNRERIEHTAAALREEIPGAAVLPIQADVAKPEQVEAMAQRTWDVFGGTHLLVNNAGVMLTGSPLDNTLDEWHWIMDINFWGVLHGIRAFVPRMLAQGEEGHVVNVASMSGVLSSPAQSAYNASKHAVFTITEGLYYAVREKGAKIGVSVAAPSWTRTSIDDMQRNRPPELKGLLDSPAAGQQKLVDIIREGVASGISPEEAADAILAGVRQDRLYILTHHDLGDAVRERAENIIHQRNPG
jgi:NAD(P)-dependent dehydrogenase (short-subunit alcohol dehydrogenase family)